MSRTVHTVRNAGYVLLGWSMTEEVAFDLSIEIERDHDVETEIREEEYDPVIHGEGERIVRASKRSKAERA